MTTLVNKNRKLPKIFAKSLYAKIWQRLLINLWKTYKTIPGHKSPIRTMDDPDGGADGGPYEPNLIGSSKSRQTPSEVANE